MKIRLIAILTVLTLASAFFFVGCGKDPKNADEATTVPGGRTLYTTTVPESTTGAAAVLTAAATTAAVTTDPQALTTVLTTVLTTAATTVPVIATDLPTATDAPTAAPTQAPTAAPTTTQSPTAAPTTTQTPTEAPVAKGPASAAEAASAIAAHSELFEEEMASASSSRALALFGIDGSDVAECAYYAASAAVAEEILVVKAADSSAVSAILQGIDERKETQLEDYADYVPKEVPKLESAVTYTNGDYVIFCVSGDSSAASSVINGLF